MSLFHDVPAAWYTFNYASDSGPYGFYSSETDTIQITTKNLVNVQCKGVKIYGSNQSMLLYFLGRQIVGAVETLTQFIWEIDDIKLSSPVIKEKSLLSYGSLQKFEI